MNIPRLAAVALAIFSLTPVPGRSQGLLNKIKKQTEQKILKKTDDTIDDVLFGNDNKTTDSQVPERSPTGESPGGMTNTTGSGLVIEPPDVLKNIGDAEQACGIKNYSAARHAVRQAMVGIEMEIGHKILNSLPSSVDGLDVAKEKDKVTSMSYGFVGLTMERIYENDDKQLTLSIGNNSALLSAVNLMIGSGAYSSTSDDQNYKQTVFKGYKSVLQYDSSSGYTLSVPFGQSSIFVLNGINYTSESDIMSAADNFDIEPIKLELGEK